MITNELYFSYIFNEKIENTSALRLLALRGLRTLLVRTRAFGPRFGGKLLLMFQVNIIFGISVPDYP